MNEKVGKCTFAHSNRLGTNHEYITWHINSIWQNIGKIAKSPKGKFKYINNKVRFDHWFEK